MPKPVSYSDAGVSIDTANRTVAKIRDLARSTFNSRTLTEIGSFGGMFDARFPEMESPILVTSADGVGTKLKIAFLTGRHDTIGRDLVNHCVNDILVQGAEPLFFLDYFACGELSAETTAYVVEGLSGACRENGCVLLGGETAEMPGFYEKGEYDLAGFIVGIVDREDVIDGKRIRAGDVVLGLESNGLHTNGYSLARKLFLEIGGYPLDSRMIEFGNRTLGETLLEPHKSYLPALRGLIGRGSLRGIAHITGGGLVENLPRILPDNVSVEIARGTWTEPPVFSLMQKIGHVDETEMFRTFNMGVGMALICSEGTKKEVMSHIAVSGERCLEIGRVVSGEGKVYID